MDSLIWALSTSIFVMLIVYFLPIGLTKKGKFIVVWIGLLLALAGLAATTSFSFLPALFMLLVLIFFVSYILDNRVGTVLFVHDESSEQQDIYEDSNTHTIAEIEETNESNELDHSTAAFKLSNENTISQLRKGQDEEFGIPAIETDNDDISFLLNRRLSLEDETMEEKEHSNLDVDYLAEIEHLLKKDSTDSARTNKPFQAEDKAAGKLDGIDEIPVLPFHEKEDKE